MTETVTRHRGELRDEDGKLVTATDVSLSAFAVAPGAGSRFNGRFNERGREGVQVAAIVYFVNAVDLTDADELTVRQERYQIIVNDWTFGGFSGREVLCTRGQG